MYSIQPPLPGEDFFALPNNDRLVLVLGTLELGPLLSCLGEGRVGAGRRGFGGRPLLYALIAGWVYEPHSTCLVPSVHFNARRQGHSACGVSASVMPRWP